MNGEDECPDRTTTSEKHIETSSSEFNSSVSLIKNPVVDTTRDLQFRVDFSGMVIRRRSIPAVCPTAYPQRPVQTA